jgi:hypothetical protein
VRTPTKPFEEGETVEVFVPKEIIQLFRWTKPVLLCSSGRHAVRAWSRPPRPGPIRTDGI